MQFKIIRNKIWIGILKRKLIIFFSSVSYKILTKTDLTLQNVLMIYKSFDSQTLFYLKQTQKYSSKSNYKIAVSSSSTWMCEIILHKS